MKRTLLIFLSVIATSAFAQNCTSCTTTISGIDPTPQFVPAGTTLCIPVGAELSGDVSITGGTVCIEGTLSCTNIGMTSGTIENYGILVATAVGVSGGVINNYINAAVFIDSLGIAIDGTITNAGQWESGDVGLSKLGSTQPVWENTGSFEADSLGVNNWTINNESGSWVVNHDMGISNGAVFNNDGLFDVWGDLGISATINNSDQMTVGGDLTISGTLHNTCTVHAMSNFSSSGTVTGPTSGCGSIAVDSSSTNSGDFGSDGSYLDLCDATGGGFDGNVGTLGSNVTHCVCTSNCNASTDLAENVRQEQIDVYPNPSLGDVNFIFSTDADRMITLYDVQGKVVHSSAFTSSAYKIEKGVLPSGLYLYQITDNLSTYSGKIAVE